MDEINFAEICSTTGCRIDSPYDVIKIRHTDDGIQLVPVKLKRNSVSNPEPGRIKIRMFSDYSCPWCMLAYAVIESMKNRFDIHIEHIGYEIHPEIDIKGKKASGNVCAENAIRRINNRGKEYGIKLQAADISPNTHKALVVGEYAKVKGVHDAYVKAMWEAYLVNGIDIGNTAEICRIAELTGLNADEIAMAVENPEYENALAENMEEARLHNIKAVPSFIMNDTYIVSGAEDESFFERIFERL